MTYLPRGTQRTKLNVGMASEQTKTKKHGTCGRSMQLEQILFTIMFEESSAYNQGILLNNALG